MVNASLCTVELWMLLGDVLGSLLHSDTKNGCVADYVLGGLLSSQELEV